jgi:hypothetical protein
MVILRFVFKYLVFKYRDYILLIFGRVSDRYKTFVIWIVWVDVDTFIMSAMTIV